MSEEQGRRVHGTIIRGADGALYFIPDAVMAPYRIEEQGRERAGALLAEGDASATLAARHVSLPPEALGRLNQLTDDISFGRHHEPIDPSMGRHVGDPTETDVVDPSMGRHVGDPTEPDVVDPSMGRHVGDPTETDMVDPSMGRHVGDPTETDVVDPSMGRHVGDPTETDEQPARKPIPPRKPE
jgi:hypothetical protein